MDISLVNLKYFCDAVKLDSLSAAATVNCVTQSAISQGIAKLEQTLGVSLVAHHPNRFRLTPQGNWAFQEASEILQKAAAFKEQIFLSDGIGSLEFACTYSFARAVIPKYLKRFRADYPEIKVSFYLGKNADIKRMLKMGTIDFGIGPDEGEFEGWKKREIYLGSFGLYCSAQIPQEKYASQGFILAESDCPDTLFFKEIYKKKYGQEPNISLEVNSWEVIANLTAEGLGIGHFPDYIAKNQEGCFNRCLLDLELFACTICAFFPNRMRLRKSSEIFLSYFS